MKYISLKDSIVSSSTTDELGRSSSEVCYTVSIPAHCEQGIAKQPFDSSNENNLHIPYNCVLAYEVCTAMPTIEGIPTYPPPGGGGGAGGEIPPAFPCPRLQGKNAPVPGCPPSGPIVIIPIEDGPSNNDDYDGIAEIKDITDNITNPCIKSTLDVVNSSNLKNSITDILYNTFSNSSDFNINFIDIALNDIMKDATTSSVVYPSGRLDFTIKLNTEVLPNASKEYTAATIYHEIVHAYLTRLGQTPGTGLQHITMANDYIVKLTNSLISAFPNLDILDAKALAWGGIQDTPAFDSIRINHPIEYIDLISRNSKFRVSTSGTPCN